MKEILEKVVILYRISKNFVSIPKKFFSIMMSLLLWLIIIIANYSNYEINLEAKIFYYVCYIGLGLFIISHFIAEYELKKLSLILCILSLVTTLCSGSSVILINVINIWLLIPVTLYTMFLVVHLGILKYRYFKI